MTNHEQLILRLLSETREPLYPSEIAEHLNQELGPPGAYTAVEVVNCLLILGDRVAQAPEGGWMLKRLE
jgi:hypothetical protein